MLELMDGPTLQVVRAYRDLGLPADAQAMLIAQCDDQRSAVAELTDFLELCRSFGAEDVLLAEDAREGELLIEARSLVGGGHEARGAELVEDVCVLRGRLANLLRGLAETSRRHGVLVTCAGHAGDGNMHPSIVFDPDDPDALEPHHLLNPGKVL